MKDGRWRSTLKANSVQDYRWRALHSQALPEISTSGDARKIALRAPPAVLELIDLLDSSASCQSAPSKEANRVLRREQSVDKRRGSPLLISALDCDRRRNGEPVRTKGIVDVRYSDLSFKVGVCRRKRTMELTASRAFEVHEFHDVQRSSGATY
jgi:hypothetical protein